MKTVFKKSIISIALLSCAALTTQAHAQTQISQATMDAANQTITQACPVRWQNVNQKLVIPELASDAIWVDATDRQAFVDYINPIITQTNSQANAEQIADDVPSVAAECATARTALLDLLLVKEPNDVILGMRALKKTLENQVAFGKDGSSQDLAAKSCLAIKQGYEQSEDGTYWVDFDGAGSSVEPQEVYCDMTTDGGGWTFFAYLAHKRIDDNGGGNSALLFFEQAVGNYAATRIKKSEHYSLGVLPLLDDTEMMVTIQNANPQAAKSINRFIRFKYEINSPSFNYGPLPCTPSSAWYSIELEPEELDYSEGYFRDFCSTTRWIAQSKVTWYSPWIIDITSSFTGLRNYPIVRRNDSYADEPAWFYVR